MADKKQIVKVCDQKLNAVARKYEGLATTRKKVANDEEHAKTELTEAIKGHIAEHGTNVRFQTGRVVITPSVRSGQSRISGEKLLELGVSPDIIKQATTVGKPSVSYGVRIEEE